MVTVIVEPNTCIRGCCTSKSIPLHLRPGSYTLFSKIAYGAESVVYEATLNGVKVAAKKPVLSSSQHLDKFHKELQLLCKIDHPGIAKFVAANAKPPNYMFFFKLYEPLNLSQKLHVEEWVPTIHQVLTITIHLAKALQYLHSLEIVHRDVKPANILLDENYLPHLADFGLAEYKKDLKPVSIENWKSSGKPTGGFHKKHMVGTLLYMAPEVLRKEIASEKSDVYSFGITINELLTGIVPYTDHRVEAQAHTVLEMNYTEQQLTAAVVSEGLRPVLGTGATQILLSLIQRCWDPLPEKRPTFDDIIASLGPTILEHPNLERVEEKNMKKNEIKAHPQIDESVNWFTQGGHLSKMSVSENYDEKVLLFGNYLNDPQTYRPVLTWGSFATCGRRETMEDTHFMLPNICNLKEIHAFGIFDGHRGAAAAEFSAGAMPGLLQASGYITRNPHEALSEAFIKTDSAFRKELESKKRRPYNMNKKEWHPGCTAVAALIVGNRLFVANAGDCRTILCRSGRFIALTKDHVASCDKERERVISAGGQVKWQVDTWRVGSAALQVTRSIGDDDLKPAVTAEPEISETILSAEDEYMVMASDGLWDVMSNDEVINIIRGTVKDGGMCSKRLATEAAGRGSKDNITVIVVFLRPVSTAERIY